MTRTDAGRTPASLVVAAASGVVALLVAAVGLAADQSTISGAPARLEPTKFAVSISVYCATVAWLVRQLPGHRRLLQTVCWGTTLALIGESTLMDMQVLRGTSSHFNTTTTCDAAVYATMGALVGVVFVAALTPAIVLMFVRTLVVASTGYAGLVALLTWEAELGRPLRWPQI